MQLLQGYFACKKDSYNWLLTEIADTINSIRLQTGKLISQQRAKTIEQCKNSNVEAIRKKLQQLNQQKKGNLQCVIEIIIQKMKRLVQSLKSHNSIIQNRRIEGQNNYENKPISPPIPPPKVFFNIHSIPQVQPVKLVKENSTNQIQPLKQPNQNRISPNKTPITPITTKTISNSQQQNHTNQFSLNTFYLTPSTPNLNLERVQKLEYNQRQQVDLVLKKYVCDSRDSIQSEKMRQNIQNNSRKASIQECRKLDNKIYHQASDYLSSVIAKKIRQNSPNRGRRSKFESPIMLLQESKKS